MVTREREVLEGGPRISERDGLGLWLVKKRVQVVEFRIFPRDQVVASGPLRSSLCLPRLSAPENPEFPIGRSATTLHQPNLIASISPISIFLLRLIALTLPRPSCD